MAHPQITHYFLRRSDNTLRHGHVFVDTDPNKEQWHNADQRHYSKPNTHDREHSFDVDMALEYWSTQYDQVNISDEKKRELVLRAKASHDRVPYVPPTTQPKPKPLAWPETTPTPAEPELEPEPEDETPVPTALETHAPTPTPTLPDADDAGITDDSIIEMLAELPDKIEALEHRADDIEATAQEQARHLSNTRGAVSDVDSRLTTLQHSVADRFNETHAKLNELEQRTPRPLEITIHSNGAAHTVPPGTYHQDFQMLLDVIGANDPVDRNIWLVGPAGSSKTTTARKVAEVLNLPCYVQPTVMRAHELFGFFNTTGYQTTWLREAYEKGGVCLLDEIDRSDARALVVLNGALSGDQVSFPDKVVTRHPNCIVFAAANTYGQGADQQYVGAMKQDAALLDRFLFMEWPIDEAFERAIAPNLDWTEIVQRVRAAAVHERAKMIISPRASIRGGNMLNRGLSREVVVRTVFGQYIKHNLWHVIGAAAIEWAKHEPTRTPTPTAALANAPTLPVTPGTNGALHHVDFSNARVFGSTR